MNMREKMARAMAARYFSYPKSLIDQCWAELADRKGAHKTWLKLADTALDTLTANPGKAVLDAALNSGACGGYGYDETDCIQANPGEVFQAMIAAIKAGE